MTLNRRASLLFLVALALYIGISFFLPTEGISYGASLALSAFAVSIPAFLIPAVVFRRKNRFPLYHCPRFSHILICLALGVGCIFLNIALVNLQEAITFGVEINSTAVDVGEGLASASVPLMILTVAVIPAICEEFIMRGALLETWRRTSFIGAALLTSLLFGLLHASPSNILVYFAMGMLFAVVYNITRNVWTTVIIHFVNNMMSVVMLAVYGAGDEAAEAAEEIGEITRGTYVSEFISFIFIAAIIIIPMITLLKNSCRSRSIGMYADKLSQDSAEALPKGAFDNDESSADAQPLVAVDEERRDILGRPVSELLQAEADAPQVQEPQKKESLLADPLLWVALIFLIGLNVLAGLIEFGVIDVALE